MLYFNERSKIYPGITHGTVTGKRRWFLRLRVAGACIFCAFIALIRPVPIAEMFHDADHMNMLRQRKAVGDRMFSQVKRR
jgi:hypothetical protein